MITKVRCLRWNTGTLANDLRAGHSLGGALATLAAIELRRACSRSENLQLSCYVFGAPRTGDHTRIRVEASGSDKVSG